VYFLQLANVQLVALAFVSSAAAKLLNKRTEALYDTRFRRLTVPPTGVLQLTATEVSVGYALGIWQSG
jgi:hypothetical protein